MSKQGGRGRGTGKMPPIPRKTIAQSKQNAERESKKRPSSLVRKHAIGEFFDVNLPGTFPMDDEFISSLTEEELRVDVDAVDEVIDKDEKVRRWVDITNDEMDFLLPKIQEHARNLDAAMDYKNSVIRALKDNNNSSMETRMVIIVPTGHQHLDIRLPERVRSEMPKLFNRTDDVSMTLVDDREQYNIYNTKRFDTFEDFIVPKSLHDNAMKKKWNGSIKELDQKIASTIGVTTHGFEFLQVQESKRKANVDLIAACYRLDERATLYLCTVFRSYDYITGEMLKRGYTNVRQELSLEDMNKALNMKAEFAFHFYFGCRCYDPKNKGK